MVEKRDMILEAMERMRLFLLDEVYIEGFGERTQVLVSKQEFIKNDAAFKDKSGDIIIYEPEPEYICANGNVFSLEIVPAAEIEVDEFFSLDSVIEELECLYDVLIYHVHCRVDSELTQCALFYIGQDDSKWDEEWQKVSDGTPSAYITTNDPESGVLHGCVFVRPVLGKLFRISGFMLGMDK